MNSSDCESVRRWIPLSIYTARYLYTFCIFNVEATNSFGVFHHVITDYVSRENPSNIVRPSMVVSGTVAIVYLLQQLIKLIGQKFISAETTNLYLQKPQIYIC